MNMVRTNRIKAGRLTGSAKAHTQKDEKKRETQRNKRPNKEFNGREGCEETQDRQGEKERPTTRKAGRAGPLRAGVGAQGRFTETNKDKRERRTNKTTKRRASQTAITRTKSKPTFPEAPDEHKPKAGHSPPPTLALQQPPPGATNYHSKLSSQGDSKQGSWPSL